MIYLFLAKSGIRPPLSARWIWEENKLAAIFTSSTTRFGLCVLGILKGTVQRVLGMGWQASANRQEKAASSLDKNVSSRFHGNRYIQLSQWQKIYFWLSGNNIVSQRQSSRFYSVTDIGPFEVRESVAVSSQFHWFRYFSSFVRWRRRINQCTRSNV